VESNRSRKDSTARCRHGHVHPCSMFRIACLARLLREHLPDLLVAQVDLVHRVAALLEWHVFIIAVGRDEDLGIPDEPLAGGEVGDLRNTMLAGAVWRTGRSTASCRCHGELGLPGVWAHRNRHRF
jgi:hypothetical protein